MPSPFESLPLPPEANVEDARRLYFLLTEDSKSAVAEVMKEWSVARVKWDASVNDTYTSLLGFMIHVPTEEEVEPAQEFLRACQVPATVALRK